LRHGALSDLAGKVEIIWRVLGGADQDGANPRQKDRRFHMVWNEVAASPVSPPDHKGFGRIVIEQTVRATLRGTVTLAFPPSGMRWCIDAPDSCLASSGQSMAA
jgi:two-component sensor histidine kinase